MTREEWLEARKNGIGGSDAATILGLNPYKTTIELWEEKTGDMQSYQLDGYERVSFSKFTDNEIIKFNINAKLTNQ